MTHQLQPDMYLSSTMARGGASGASWVADPVRLFNQHLSSKEKGGIEVIFKRGSTGVYYYEFRFGDERVRRSTKQRNPRVARQMEAAHKTQLAKGEVGIEQRKKTPTLRVFTEESFLPHVRSNFRAKPKTLEYYENGVKQILRYGGLSRLKLDSITGEDIDQYVDGRLSRGLGNWERQPRTAGLTAYVQSGGGVEEGTRAISQSQAGSR